jgi:hypothetical protein
MLTSEDPNNNRVVGSVHSFRWPPRSSTRRAQTIDDERRIAPKKSMRLSLERLDCLGFDSSVDTWSFQATRAKASIVGRHCPRKDLLYGQLPCRFRASLKNSYHRQPIVSVRYPPIGPPRLLPVVAAMFT